MGGNGKGWGVSNGGNHGRHLGEKAEGLLEDSERSSFARGVRYAEVEVGPLVSKESWGIKGF